MEFNGLPMHPLIIHVVVVFAPLAGIGGILYAAVPRWRWWLRWPLVACALVAAVAGILAVRSGEDLEAQRHLQTLPELATHSARGPLFETWVICELQKRALNQGQPAPLYFWRDNVGHEIDVLFETGAGLQAIEIKSGRTFASDWTAAARKWVEFSGEKVHAPAIVFGGDGRFDREGCRVLGWRELAGQ